MSMFFEALRKREQQQRSPQSRAGDASAPVSQRGATVEPPGPSLRAEAASIPAAATATVQRPVGTSAPLRAPTRRAKVAEMLRFDRVHVDLARLAASGLVTLDPGSGRSFEAFRRIKRPLLAAAFAEEPRPRLGNVVAVSSARAAEGKTYTALNLAVSITHEKGKSAMILDADLEHRGLTRWLALGNRPGLSDYLACPALLPHQIMVGVREIEKLLVLPAGPRRPDAAELVASTRMQVLLGSLSALFPDRLIVVDCPPLLDDSSGWEIARHCGQLLVVVAEGQTRLEDVQEILGRTGDAAKLRFVLNKSLRGEAESSYGAA